MKRYGIFLAVFTLLFAVHVDAQQVSGWPSAPPAQLVQPGVPAIAAWSVGQRAENSDYRKAIQAIKDAESEADKAKAVESLRGVLETQYETSLENYESYLDKMEEKVRELRKQIDRRRDAKMEMVDLRLKILTSEADGLGWPDERPSRYFLGPGQSLRGLSPFAPQNLYTVPAPRAGVTEPKNDETVPEGGAR